MLEVTSASVEEELKLDFASIYKESLLYKWVIFYVTSWNSGKTAMSVLKC